MRITEPTHKWPRAVVAVGLVLLFFTHTNILGLELVLVGIVCWPVEGNL